MATLALVILTACAAPREPLFSPGQVIELRDGVLRTRDAWTADVSVHRTFAEHEAEGTVELRDIRLDVARRSNVIRAAIGRAWLAILRQVPIPSSDS